jgi:3-dehydroquinate synthetase
MAQESTVRVELGQRGYDVVVGSGLLFQLGERARALFPNARRAFVVDDTGLPGSRLAVALSELEKAGFAVAHASVVASEAGKSLKTLEQVLISLAGSKHERGDVVVALGGGVVGDLAGFAAASYRRGVPVIQCPTTLLAMVDASVGGKTGVNLDLGTAEAPDLKKNAVGAFHQPSLVLADTDSLGSLAPRHLRAGLAECIKHGLIGADAGDPGLLEWTGKNLEKVVGLDRGLVTELVTRNVAVKARIVAGDEREEASSGGRALLNLGHTFGHAIETLPGLVHNRNPANVQLLHGEAVGLGLVAAAVCSAKLGLCPLELVDQVRDLLARAGLPTKVTGLPSDEVLLTLMGHDKKAVGGAMRLVLPVGGGRAKVVANPAREAVVAGLAAIRG